LALVTASIIGALSSNPLLTLLCLWVVPLFVILLWRRFEPPILLFAVMVQWAEVSTKVVHADILNISIEAMFEDAIVVESVVRGLTGLLVLALGMRFALKGLREQPAEEVWAEGLEICRYPDPPADFQFEMGLFLSPRVRGFP
jgi:hypothetical protein